MGRLLGLELNNFKSYKGIVKVGFGESNFTSIIGPNGSGKSNMMDAISFVLGVRTNHLRSNMVKDLVYRGVIDETQNQSDSDDENFEDANHPSTAYVKAFYKQDEHVVELMRSINKNGDSAYKIDNKTKTYKEYASFLASENILIKAKNFLVFQGDVEQIASQSAMDLSKLFEEVSGSIQYKKEYDELKERMEMLSQATADTIKNRRRVQNELQSFEEGINQDEEYKKSVQKKKKLQKNYSLWQLYHLEQKKKDIGSDIKESNQKIADLKLQMKNEEQNLSRAKTSFSRNATTVTKQKSTLEYKQKDKEKLMNDLNLINLPQRATAKRINNIEKRIESFEKDIERQKTYIEKFENQLKVIRKSKESFEKNIKESNQNQNKYQLSEEDIQIYEELNGKYLANGGSVVEEKLALLGNEKEEITEELNRFNTRVEVSKQKISDEIQVTLENNEIEAANLTASLNEKNAQHTEKTNELKNLQSEIESTSNKEYDLNYRLRETLVRIDDLSANQRETMKEKKLRENVATLKRFFPGVKGLVHDLCHPKKDKYAIAVSTILGRNFDSIIVDNVNTAQECISYLKKQRSGAASFIPLDTIESEVASLPVLGGTGYLLAINAIEYSAEYERAMQYICSNAIVCDTLDIAKRLKWTENVKSKLVTLQGAYIHKAGLMTGGTSNDQNNRWDKEEYQSLMSLKDTLLQEIEEVTASNLSASLNARDLESSISLLNSEISNIRIELTQINRAIEENKVELKYQNDLIIEEYTPKISSLAEKRDTLDRSIKDKNKEKESLQNVIYKDFTNRLGFTIKEYESHSGEILRKQSKELQQLQKEILNVDNKLQFEVDRLRTTERRLEKAQKDLKGAVEESLNHQEEKKQLHSKIEKCDQDILKQKEDIAELQNIYNLEQREIAVIEDRINEVQLSVQTEQRQIDEANGEGEKLDLERVGILQNCKISSISIPATSDTDLMDLPIAQIDEETIKISNNLEIHYDELPAKYKESSGHSVKQDLLSDIKRIEEKLSTLQPNARASERYDEAQERFDEIDRETGKLKSEEKKVFTQFLRIKKIRKDLFEKAFDYVSEHLDAIYRELTKNPHSSAELAGGNASLTLEDEDEPFNAGIRYHATPPLKRFKDMEYLSGGEKTVAALALLFAINSYQPSPFFVLDEVDAALDITNVERIATYIKRHGNPELQFIVISLKNSLFEKSDSLVGVYRQPQENTSRIVTLDLQNYAD